MKKFVYNQYKDYIEVQIQHQQSKFRTSSKSYKRYIEAIKACYPEAKKVLCVGSRDVSEVNAFRGAGYDAIGIDLYTDNADVIKIVDMQKMHEHFSENDFDIIFSCHSLEHSYDPERVLTSFRSIASQGCFLVLPVNLEPNVKDPVVFGINKEISNGYQADRAGDQIQAIKDEFSSLMKHECNVKHYSLEPYYSGHSNEHWIGLTW
jgi:hypothetical protein